MGILKGLMARYLGLNYKLLDLCVFLFVFIFVLTRLKHAVMGMHF